MTYIRPRPYIYRNPIMEISPGVRMGAFEVRTLLGAGGMGSVYRARDQKLGRDVAIKVLHDRYASSGDYLRRFEREARSASALNHPNILTIFEINESNGTPFIAMELIEGSRLRDLLHDGPLSIRKLLAIATQIADGLAAAHERGIVHRDLKPENVMITAHGLVKILDFGLARPGTYGESHSDAGVTEDAITQEHDPRFIGTAGYMSPEQARGQIVDHRSDQFSFGAVLYEMATGRRAFGGKSIASMIESVIRAEPQSVQQLNPKVPAPLRWIIERCLSRHPSDRYASTADLARELHTLRERLPDTGSGSESFPSRVFSRRRALLGTAAGALFIAAAANLWMRNPPAAVLTAPPYLAVLPFSDGSGTPRGALFSRGFAEAVSARLQKFSSIQVIPPTATAALSDNGSDPKRIAQELGATFILSASVEWIGDTLRVKYALRDPSRNETVASDTVSGSADNVWALQDALSQAIARRLGLQENTPPTQQAELETGEEQDLYLRALGNLVDQHEEPKALDAGLALLRELLETASGSPLVHAALARTYLEKYNLTKDSQFAEKAVQAADRARALAPDSPDVLLAQAAVQRFTGRFTDAIATYKRTLALKPNSVEAVIGLAKSYQGTGQLEDAERTYIRGVHLRPTWWSSHNELGVLYLTRGRYDEAGQLFRKVTELNPNTPWGHTNLGIVHVTRERLPEAISAFTKANALREDPAAWANLGYCYYYLGQYDKSADAFRKAAALVPRRATYWANLADACRWTSTCKAEVEQANARAIELLQQELATNPGLSRARATLAVCLAKAGRARDADEQMTEALRIEPENPARMFQAARVANMNGKPAEAMAWLRRASDGGYGRFELPRDPEFEELRKSEAFRSMFNN